MNDVREGLGLPTYTADMFASPSEECDIVTKGGVTSGIVYPFAILELRADTASAPSTGSIAATNRAISVDRLGCVAAALLA